MDGYTWSEDATDVDWDELSELYRIAPLGEKPPDVLRTVFGNSRFARFARQGDTLVAAGRALADGLDCAYIADIAVHPDHQGRGLGQELLRQLVAAARGHRKIILYAAADAQGFYARFGFLPMVTAMAIWDDPDEAIRAGVLRRPDPS